MAWTQTVTPTSEPLNLDEVKEQCGIRGDDLNTWFGNAIVAAREKAEADSGLQLITATWTLTLDYNFPLGEILLDKPPIGSVSSVQYVDENGTTQTWAASKYTVSKGHVKTRIVPAWSETWPTTRLVVDAVTVTFTAGYGTATAVPEILKHGMRLLVGHWFDNRGDSTDVKTHLIANGYRDCIMAKGLLELV